MRNVKGLAGTLAALGIAMLLLPGTAGAQGSGLRDRVSSGDRGVSDRGRTRTPPPDRAWSRDRWYRDRDWSRHSHSRDRSDVRFGIWLGPAWDSLWWGWPWYAPYDYRYGSAYGYTSRYPYRYGYPYTYDYPYTPPPVVVQPPQPYEPDETPGPAGPSAWYLCEEPRGYYPYVRECPGGWTSVPATPEVTPPPAAAPPPPPEQVAPPSAAEPSGPVPEEYRWYYCRDPKGYYPYVRECPSGWQETSPAPPPGP